MSLMPDAGCPPAAGDIRDALAGILGSESFSRSPKISRLLTYLVETQIAGDAECLKETAIATSVFDQRQDFNPRTNPIVRVNASRLRNLLRLYYADPNVDSSVTITLPDVGYAPIFSSAPQASDTESDSEPTERIAAPHHAVPQVPAHSSADDAGAGSMDDDVSRSKEARPAKQPMQISAVLGMPCSVGFVIANLVVACIFAALLNRTDTTPQGNYVISMQQPVGETVLPSSLIMLCNQDSTPAARYPVKIGDTTVFCHLLKPDQGPMGVDTAENRHNP